MKKRKIAKKPKPIATKPEPTNHVTLSQFERRASEHGDVLYRLERSMDEVADHVRQTDLRLVNLAHSYLAIAETLGPILLHCARLIDKPDLDKVVRDMHTARATEGIKKVRTKDGT